LTWALYSLDTLIVAMIGTTMPDKVFIDTNILLRATILQFPDYARIKPTLLTLNLEDMKRFGDLVTIISPLSPPAAQPDSDHPAPG
jgi:hypothetical protein